MGFLCALAFLLSACAPREEERGQGAYKVYFAVRGERGGEQSVDYEYRDLEPGEETVGGLIRILLAGPHWTELASPFLPGVTLRSAKLEENGQLRLDLSEQYNGLPGVYLTVANSCLLLTLSQVQGVESLYITVEGKSLPYQTVQPLTLADLLVSGGEEANVSLTALLYFPRADGEGLGREYRTVVKTENESLPAAVLTALISGPTGEGLVPAIPAGTALRSVRVENGTCLVDLSRPFLEGEPQDEAQARAAVYSIINTLCALDARRISAVQLLVEGESVAAYGGLPTLSPLEPNYSLVNK